MYISRYKESLQNQGFLTLHIRLTPGISPSKVKEIVTENINGEIRELWRIQVGSPPEDGRANKELIALLASLFDVKKNTIMIESGKHSREKLVRISLRT